MGEFPGEHNAKRYNELLEKNFKAFPDSLEEMPTQGLAYFRYFVTERGINEVRPQSLEDLIDAGHVEYGSHKTF